MADLDLGNIFSSLTRSSESTIEANQQVFTPEVLAEIARQGLKQHELIETAITKLLAIATQTASSTAGTELAKSIESLRRVSLTYLPKV